MLIFLYRLLYFVLIWGISDLVLYPDAPTGTSSDSAVFQGLFADTTFTFASGRGSYAVTPTVFATSTTSPIQNGAIEGKVQIASPSSSDRRQVSGRYQRRPASHQSDQKRAVLIWIENDRQAATSSPGEPVVLDQINLEFKPDLLVVRQHETIRIHNSDPVYHNVFSFSPVKRFDVGRRPQGEYYDVTFERQGLVDVFCDIHSNMHAVIYVVSPLTVDWVRISADEEFRFSGLEDGTYTLNVFSTGFDLYSIQVEVESSVVRLESIILTS